MTPANPRYRLDQALDQLETAILPDIAFILTRLWDMAGSTRGGVDGIRLRTLATEIDSVARRIESLAPAFLDSDDLRRASAEALITSA